MTRPLTGEAAPGTPIYIKSDYTYWISATKEGYICETIAPWIGKDFESNNPLEIRCRVSGATSEYDYVIIGPLQYTDETLLQYGIAKGESTTIYWNTTNRTSLQNLTLYGGGGTLNLLNGTEYTTGQNITIEIYSYNTTTGTYTKEATIYTEYKNKDIKRPAAELEGQRDNKELGTIIFIGIIIIASIAGRTIKKQDGTGTGYYIFAGLTIIATSYTNITLGATIALIIGGIGYLDETLLQYGIAKGESTTIYFINKQGSILSILESYIYRKWIRSIR